MFKNFRFFYLVLFAALLCGASALAATSAAEVEKLRAAAEKGDPVAQKNLGNCYYSGEGVPQDYDKAVYWYRKSADQGYANAQNNLGNCYANGYGVKKDPVEAVKWYRMAAEQGLSNAQYDLALCYYNGEGVEKDLKHAVFWFRKAAEQGSPAQFNLALCYANGYGVEKDLKQAVEWYRKAAEQEIKEAQFNLALCYENGEGVAKDSKLAVYWYRKAAEQEVAKAQFCMGWCYANGEGVEKDLKHAVFWFRKAAEQEHANAQYDLALCYANGYGVEKDLKQAVEWYRKAAEQGDAKAQFNLGVCYNNGRGVPKDLQQAVFWWRKAAEQGDAKAQFNLGNCYYFGEGAEKDLKEAVYWWRKAAEQGNAKAQNRLGNCFYHGSGVKRDLEQAIRWYRKAAEQGYAPAQFKLARCYANGYGVEKNPAEAEKWRKKALEQSDLLSQYGLSYRYADLRRIPDISAQDGNPYYQLRSILDSMQGDEYEFENLEAELNVVVPRACRVGEITVTADEIKFLLLAFRLDYGINAGKKDKEQEYLRELETLLASAPIDFKKLAKLFDGLDFAALTVDIGMSRGYLLVCPSAAVVERIQTALKKYEKGSTEYILLSYLLGKAYTQTGKIELAAAPLEYAFAELEKRGMKEGMKMAAADLSVIAAYSSLGGRDEESRRLAGMIASRGDIAPDPYHQAMLRFSRALHIPPSEWTADAKREFENDRSVVMANASDDVQFFIDYAISAVVRSEHGYPAEEVLPDLEQAFLYRAMLWGDSDAENAEFGKLLKQIDSRLNELKDKLLQYLSEIDKADRFAYWNAKFELARQRRAALDAASAKHKDLRPLLTMVNLYLNAKQLLAYERAKEPKDQDKGRIQTATKIIRELERQFESEHKKLSPEELKIFKAFLADDIVIKPGYMTRWSRRMPPDTACIQILPLEEKILVYVIVKNTKFPPTIIDLKAKGYSRRQFVTRLVRARRLLSFNAEPEATRQALNELYALLFADLEEPLAKLKVTKLVVNASGILRYIPFAALYDGKRYLVEKYQITNVTGLDLDRLAESSDDRQFGSMKAVVFADPDGTLPSGRTEGKRVAGMFANSRLFVGDKASFDEFESMLGEVNFIHLATHAVLDPNDPQKSYIQFADGKKWYYSDMMGFNVENVDSIALSACSTAVSERSTGDGIEGMAYRLLGSSPSGSILASFWKVDDRATATLMEIYYKHIIESVKARGVLDRGGALREAQLKLLRDPATSHPYYWAAFTLFGDFR